MHRRPLRTISQGRTSRNPFRSENSLRRNIDLQDLFCVARLATNGKNSETVSRERGLFVETKRPMFRRKPLTPLPPVESPIQVLPIHKKARPFKIAVKKKRKKRVLAVAKEQAEIQTSSPNIIHIVY